MFFKRRRAARGSLYPFPYRRSRDAGFLAQPQDFYAYIAEWAPANGYEQDGSHWLHRLTGTAPPAQ
jgi:hypothetical protein